MLGYVEVEEPREHLRRIRSDRGRRHVSPPPAVLVSRPAGRSAARAFRRRLRTQAGDVASGNARTAATPSAGSRSPAGSSLRGASRGRHRRRPARGGTSRTQSSMISVVTSGWNWRPRLRPATKACGPTSDSAIDVAPGGTVNESKCHWNHGPSGTRSGSLLLTGQPADLRLRSAEHLSAEYPSEHLPAEAQPEHRHVGARSPRPSVGASRGTNGFESSNAANSEPSDTIRS